VTELYELGSLFHELVVKDAGRHPVLLIGPSLYTLSPIPISFFDDIREGPSPVELDNRKRRRRGRSSTYHARSVTSHLSERLIQSK
jgi:hypothetical protein